MEYMIAMIEIVMAVFTRRPEVWLAISVNLMILRYFSHDL